MLASQCCHMRKVHASDGAVGLVGDVEDVAEISQDLLAGHAVTPFEVEGFRRLLAGPTVDPKVSQPLVVVLQLHLALGRFDHFERLCRVGEARGAI